MLEVDTDTLLEIVGRLETQLENYNLHITDLQTLSNKIESSTDWIDAAIKPSFISYLNAYIEIYKAIAKSLESYVQFLQVKVKNFSEHEGKFS